MKIFVQIIFATTFYLIFSETAISQVNQDYKEIASRKIKSAIVHLDDEFYEEIQFDKSGRLISAAKGKYGTGLDQVEYDTLGNVIAKTSIYFAPNFQGCDTLRFYQLQYDEFGREIAEISVSKNNPPLGSESIRNENTIRTTYFGENPTFPDSAEITVLIDSSFTTNIIYFTANQETDFTSNRRARIDSSFNLLPKNSSISLEYYGDNFFVADESYKSYFADSIRKLFVAVTWVIDSVSLKSGCNYNLSRSTHEKNTVSYTEDLFIFYSDGTVKFQRDGRSYAKTKWKLDWINDELVLILDDNGKLDCTHFISISENKMTFYSQSEGFGKLTFYFHHKP